MTNHNLIEKKPSVPIPVNVSYDSDPEVIAKLMVEEAKKAVNHVPGLLSQPEPVVRFNPGFGEASLGFTLVGFIQDFADASLVESELRLRIFKRFRDEGIKMPK